MGEKHLYGFSDRLANAVIHAKKRRKIMKANYFLGGGKFELRQDPIPALGPGDVLIKVAACGVCGTDVHIYH